MKYICTKKLESMRHNKNLYSSPMMSLQNNCILIEYFDGQTARQKITWEISYANLEKYFWPKWADFDGIIHHNRCKLAKFEEPVKI